MYEDENILYCNEGSDDAVCNCNGMDFLNIKLNNITLDINFDEDDPDVIILMRHLPWHIKFGKRKALKKELTEELMQIAWHLDVDGGIGACQKMRKKK